MKQRFTILTKENKDLYFISTRDCVAHQFTTTTIVLVSYSSLWYPIVPRVLPCTSGTKLLLV